MDIQLNNESCISKCETINTCTKYCSLHAGRALERFINGIDMVETRIGEYDKRDRYGKLDLVVSGHQVWDLKSVSWLLTDISTTLDATQKFKPVCGKTPLKILEAYYKYCNMNNEVIKEKLSILQKINKNKLLIMPFKPNSICNVDVINGKVKEKNKEGVITYVIWNTCKETFKLKCELGITVNTGGHKQLLKYSITDYLDMFRLSELSVKAAGNKGDKDLIKVTDHGVIKPIAFNEGNITVAIDGTYLYLTFNDITNIIGHWDDNDNLIITKEVDYKSIKKIKNNLAKIKMHRKYIAPYLMYESNVLEA